MSGFSSAGGGIGAVLVRLHWRRIWLPSDRVRDRRSGRCVLRGRRHRTAHAVDKAVNRRRALSLDDDKPIRQGNDGPRLNPALLLRLDRIPPVLPPWHPRQLAGQRQPPARGPRSCIGIDTYPGTGRDLLGCLNDAHDWRDVLESRGYEVTMLLDGDASRAGILAGVEELVVAPGSGPRILTYAGHGSYQPDASSDEPDGIDEVLCPADVAAGRVVSDDELLDAFSRKPRGSSLTFISDCCHAGGLGLRRIPAQAPTTASSRFLPPEIFRNTSDGDRSLAFPPLRKPDRRRPALLFAACQPTELAADAAFRGRPNGAFTRTAIRALRGLPEQATYQDWYERVAEQLPDRTHPQRPLLEGTAPQRARLAFC